MGIDDALIVDMEKNNNVIRNKYISEYYEDGESISSETNISYDENGNVSHRYETTYDRNGNQTGGSDAADVTALGIPCIDNLGAKGGAIHSKDEYAICESLKQSAKMLSLFTVCL